MGKKKDLERLIAKGAQLDLEIKALAAELEPIKAQIKAAQIDQGTYVADDHWTVKVEADRRVSIPRAEAAVKKYGKGIGVEKVSVTMATLKAAVAAGTITQRVMDGLIDEGQKLTFGIQAV